MKNFITSFVVALSLIAGTVAATHYFHDASVVMADGQDN